jgi:alpha-beta hydrolase superfamily lysophospholipase
MEVAAWFLIWGMAPSIAAFFCNDKKKKQRYSNNKTLTSTNAAAAPSAVHHIVFGVERNIEIPDTVFPTELELKDLENLMPPHEHGWFDSCYMKSSSSSCYKLHYRKWVPKKPKAVIIFMHGISTHSGKAFELPDKSSSNKNDKHNDRKLNTALLAETFLKEGMALYAFDLLGHGFSEGPRFWIPDTYKKTNKQDYINFCRMVANEQPNSPLFLMGESYGCTLSLHVAKDFQEARDNATTSSCYFPPNFDSLILTAPAIIGDLPPAPVVKILTFLAGYFPLWRPFFMPNPVSPERIWRDPAVLMIRTNPRFVEMSIDGSGLPFRLGTALNLLRALQDVRTTVIPGLTVPFLILHGTEDYGVPIEGSEFLWENAATADSDKDFLRKEGAYHDLFADYVAEECMQDTMNWIHKRLEKRSLK